jgi:LysM repeat protein
MPKFRMPRPRKKLDARIRTASPPMVDDYDADEPQTKLSSAFIVVLLLHVVAVGGIYAFNSIKSSRQAHGTATASTSAPTTAKQPSTSPSPAASENTGAALHPVAVSNPLTAPAPAGPRHYMVKPGDTLTSIAKSKGVTIAELEIANSLKPGSVLAINQSLIIPVKGAVKTAPEMAKLETVPKKAEESPADSATRTYTVKKDDRLLFIAKRFNVRPDELMAVNKIKDPAKLQIGQSLKIPGKKGN